MTTITITDESGQITVAVDGAEPQPVESAEDACQIVEASFGQAEQATAEEGMAAGFQGVRGGVL